MTVFDPSVGDATLLAEPAPRTGPKLSYEIGDACWVHSGLRDKAGNVTKQPGQVVFWVDLPDLAQRIYLIRLFGDYMHLVCRDACVMSPTKEEQFPFQRTRHDEKARNEPTRIVEWRH